MSVVPSQPSITPELVVGGCNSTTTIHHWQLRDLVAAGDSSDEFLAVCDASVLQCNVQTREATAVLSLDWSPNSMAYAHGILAAGGPSSQLHDTCTGSESKPSPADGHDISGIAFSAAADRLWVGLDVCVMSYDVDTVGRRAFGHGSLC
ncbi:hypothetical protein TSOC_007176 [Tetrabaena socialis]|uniref:WD repeat domain-containing protein n=1 Tax=Tetrabaena socialis TaxID=47790 RepID=A0A2J8A1U3_9CHLO|nr:hypothetical protein TSOC_007176 [Tetrabaena socialis]|eukprot:PNH06483.1 hypothetical protein TSOC_007176 [Tetrabaena socialis]